MSGAGKWSSRILPQSTNRKSLRVRVSPLSLVQFRLGTLFQCHFGLHTLFLLLGLGLVSFSVRDGLVRVRVEFYFGTCNLNHIR